MLCLLEGEAVKGGKRGEYGGWWWMIVLIPRFLRRSLLLTKRSRFIMARHSCWQWPSPGGKVLKDRKSKATTIHLPEFSACASTDMIVHEMEIEIVYQWITDLNYPGTRENALLHLSQKRESIPNLAPMLWHSFGTVAALLQEIVNIYPCITPPTLTAYQSNRVCNALAIMQCIAVHPETKLLFLQTRIPLFLYPFLKTNCKERPFEYLRLTSLGVIGSLVKADNEEVIRFLVSTKIMPLIVSIMENGSELPRTVATFILQRILMDENGLMHVCHSYDRFSHVAMILGKLVLLLAAEPSTRLLKHVILCYVRLSDNEQAREALRQCLPDQLRDSTFSACLSEDHNTKQWLQQLLKNLEPNNDHVMAVFETNVFFQF